MTEIRINRDRLWQNLMQLKETGGTRHLPRSAHQRHLGTRLSAR